MTSDERGDSAALSMLSLDRLPPLEAVHWRRRLQNTTRPCGCKSGAALALLALVAGPVWMVVVDRPRTLLGVGFAVVVYAFVVVAAGLAGKLGGMVVGRWRHQRLRRQLVQRLAQPAAGGS